jgi:hypothetical protein
VISGISERGERELSRLARPSAAGLRRHDVPVAGMRMDVMTNDRQRRIGSGRIDGRE